MHNSSSPFKILITNIVTLNTGDAAILLGTIDILKQKYGLDTQVTVFDKHAAIAEKYYPWAEFRQSLFHRPTKSIIRRFIIKRGYGHWILKLDYQKYRLLAWLNHNHLISLAKLLAPPDVVTDVLEYCSADLIMSSGGTYLIENYDLLSAIHEYRFSLVLGKKLGFFTMSLGPFTTEVNKLNFSTIFNNSAVILIRDERSRNHLVSIGVDTSRVHLCADAAFILATRAPSRRVGIDKAPRVAISVRSMNFFHDGGDSRHLDYNEIILTAIRVAIEEFGASVTFLSTCQGITGYWTNDAITAREIHDMLPEAYRQHVEIDSSFRQPGEIIDAYKDYDAVIATRMHAAILSLCACTPVLGVAYEFKMEELFRKIDMQSLLISVGKASRQDVNEAVRQILCDRSAIRKKTAAIATSMREDAVTAVNWLPSLGRDHAQ